MRTLRDDIAWYASGSSTPLYAVADGLDRDYFLVKVADLPEVTEDESRTEPWLEVDGLSIAPGHPASDLIRESRRCIAAALHIQSRESEAAALQARRDELARELLGVDTLYEYISKPFRQTIDRLAAAEAEVARLKGEGR